MKPRDWTVSQVPAAWWRVRRINGMTAHHVLAHGDEYGKRLALVDFHCGSSRVVDLAEIEVEVVVEAVAS